MAQVVQPEETALYYKRLYPFKSIYNWLNHQHPPTRLFTHREFAFTLAGDIYLRYNSFGSAEELKREMIRLNPSRYEIGPIYSARPKDKKTVRPNMFTPQLRELVFDIDMTDYDEIRTCCSGKGICKRCWGFIAAAVDVLDHVLRDEFDYKHILWVFSGRRGIHCWISDQQALALPDESRRALVNYLEVIKGGVDQIKKVNVRGPMAKSGGGPGAPLHPMLSEALETLQEVFADLILNDQDCFLEEKGWRTLLELLPEDEDVVKTLREEWGEETDGNRTSSQDKWERMLSLIKGLHGHQRKLLQIALQDIVLQYTYPRIDSEVSKKRNHLLKAPFCIHPQTGNVCVPVDPATVHSFDPTNVPKIAELLKELDEIMIDDGEHNVWERTSLGPYVQMMDRHVSGLMKETRVANREAQVKSLDF